MCARDWDVMDAREGKGKGKVAIVLEPSSKHVFNLGSYVDLTGSVLRNIVGSIFSYKPGMLTSGRCT